MVYCSQVVTRMFSVVFAGVVTQTAVVHLSKDRP